MTLSSFPVGHVRIDRALENQHATIAALASREPDRIATAIDAHVGALEEQFLGRRLPP